MKRVLEHEAGARVSWPPTAALTSRPALFDDELRLIAGNKLRVQNRSIFNADMTNARWSRLSHTWHD